MFCICIKKPLPPGDNPIAVNKYYYKLSVGGALKNVSPHTYFSCDILGSVFTVVSYVAGTFWTNMLLQFLAFISRSAWNMNVTYRTGTFYKTARRHNQEDHNVTDNLSYLYSHRDYTNWDVMIIFM
jgi:hypothetical protein